MKLSVDMITINFGGRMAIPGGVDPRHGFSSVGQSGHRKAALPKALHRQGLVQQLYPQQG